MGSWQKPLWDLQSVDLEIELLEKKIAAVPLVLKDLDHEDTAADASVDVVRKEKQELEVALKNVEMQTESLKDKAAKLGAQSNDIRNNDEYRAMLKEIDKTKEQVDASELESLELMEQIETATQKVAAAKSAAAAKKEMHAEKRTKLAAKATEMEADLAKARARREALLPSIAKDKLSVYSRLQSGRHGKVKALGAFEADASCECCRMKLRPEIKLELQKDQLVHCDNCSVILYLPEMI